MAALAYPAEDKKETLETANSFGLGYGGLGFGKLFKQKLFNFVGIFDQSLYFLKVVSAMEGLEGLGGLVMEDMVKKHFKKLTTLQL